MFSNKGVSTACRCFFSAAHPPQQRPLQPHQRHGCRGDVDSRAQHARVGRRRRQGLPGEAGFCIMYTETSNALKCVSSYCNKTQRRADVLIPADVTACKQTD